MMTRLKNRPRLDALDNQRRRKGRSLGRRVYLASLMGVAGSLVYFFVGPLVILDSDGLVMKDQFFVESTFPARVLERHVDPGAHVRAGDLLITMQSQDVLDSIAKLSADRANLVARESQLRARAKTVRKLIPVSRQRYQQAKINAAKVDELNKRRLVTIATKSGADEALYNTQSDFTRLESEFSTIEEQLANLKEARQGLDKAISRFRDAYSNGQIRAPRNGTVGPKVPAPGEVFQVAETILELLYGEAYVLAYAPTGRLYDIDYNQSVIVSDGANTAQGRVASLGGITDALPSEFQGAFKKTERHQIMKIVFDSHPPFVLKSKVTISGMFGVNGARHVVGQMFRKPVDDITTASVGEDAGTGVNPVPLSFSQPDGARDINPYPDIRPELMSSWLVLTEPQCVTCGEKWRALIMENHSPKKSANTADGP